MQKYTNDTCEDYKNQIKQSGVEQRINILFELYKNTKIQQVTNILAEIHYEVHTNVVGNRLWLLV